MYLWGGGGGGGRLIYSWVCLSTKQSNQELLRAHQGIVVQGTGERSPRVGRHLGRSAPRRGRAFVFRVLWGFRVWGLRFQGLGFRGLRVLRVSDPFGGVGVEAFRALATEKPWPEILRS